MIKRTFHSILLLLLSLSMYATDLASFPSTAYTVAPSLVFVEDVCNLPAPTNLQVTGTTTSSIALAWNPVAGTSGYWITVTEFGAGSPTFDSAVAGTSYNVTGLKSGTWYHIAVSSVCPGTGQKGGTALKDAQTDFIIVMDGIVFRNCPDKISQDFCDDVLINESPIRMEALDASNPDRVEQFDILVVGTTSDDLKANVIYDYVPGESTSADRWAITNNLNQPPNSKSPLEIKFFHAPPNSQSASLISNTNYVMRMTIARIPLQPDKIKICWEKIINPSTTNTHEINRWVGCSPPPALLIKNDNPISTVKFAPNPFTNDLTLFLNDPASAQSTLHILDINGREVLRQPIDPGVNQATIKGAASLIPGLYLARFESPEGTQTFKVIKSQ